MVLIVLILLIVVIILWSKVGDLTRRLTDLENQVADVRHSQRVLDTRLQPGAALPTAAPPSPVTPQPPPVPAKEPAAAPARLIVPSPIVGTAKASPAITTPGMTPASPAIPTIGATPASPVSPTVGARPASPVSEAPQAPPRPPRPPVEPPPPPAAPRFDWESLVGVKLFSAIAGIALVIAAIYFLKYSIDQGWLQPPVRFAIGTITAIALLVVCEMKAARRYPVTANAMDAAAIAILFSTFFAGHALWNLISGTVTFGLLALVTATAVLLSIRRDSLFIAVLGLLGGFSTPILLSTGENRPIALFSYLLLLNIGLAWVAYRKRWTSVTWLSLILTTLYQWGWVFKFLDVNSLSLAMGIFLVFPIAAVAALLISHRNGADAGDDKMYSFQRSALISSVVPAVFAVYLAAVPAYGARPGLLFGFVLLVDAGLLAVSLARREALLHRIAGLTTLLSLAIWIAMSYAPGSWTIVLAYASAFVAFYLFAPVVADVLGRSDDRVRRTALVASLVLFVFPALAAIEPAAANPRWFFAALLALVLLVAWRAMSMRFGAAYFVAAFMAVATQAVWSAEHLILERLGTAVIIYAVFGIVALAVPVIARRTGREFTPAWGGGVVLLASLALLFFLSLGPIAPAALWALALLLAILNAALFIEGAAGRLPLLSQAGSLLSWIILATWWTIAGATVGVVPSLAVLTMLTLITLAGHAWSTRTRPADLPPATLQFWQSGLYLALIGHLFLAVLAANPAWAIPPWPLFGALVVITLATSTSSLYARTAALHAAGTIAAAIVIANCSGAAGAPPYGLMAVIAGIAVVAYALAWIALMPRQSSIAAAAAAAAAFIGTATIIVTTARGGQPPFAIVTLAHVINIAVLLGISWRFGWQTLSVAAVAPAWFAVWQWQWLPTATASQLLVLAGALYALFVAYPLVLGSRIAKAREPYFSAVLASAMFFFAGRTAFERGELDWMIGVIPVGVGATLAVLFRQLVRLEPPSDRDMGRLALVAGAALAFVTVAIPLQLEQQWITIGWALEGAALAWLYYRIPHRGLLAAAAALLAVVFVRLALNPSVLVYEPRGSLRIFNWYLYTYLVCAAAMLVAGWWFSKTEDRLGPLPRASHWLPAAAGILLFLLVNIEIADYYATGPAVVFRFGVTLSQDLTYTIAWLIFGMILLAVGISLGNRASRVTAVSLIAITTFKCFLYDLRELEGLYRVASFVGLAMSLALVALALQKYVLSKPRNAT